MILILMQHRQRKEIKIKHRRIRHFVEDLTTIRGPLTVPAINLLNMEALEGLLELPGALFRKLVTSRNESFDQILKDHTKNKLVGLCILIIIIAIVFTLIAAL